MQLGYEGLQGVKDSAPRLDWVDGSRRARDSRSTDRNIPNPLILPNPYSESGALQGEDRG